MGKLPILMGQFQYTLNYRRVSTTLGIKDPLTMRGYCPSAFARDQYSGAHAVLQHCGKWLVTRAEMTTATAQIQGPK